MGRQTIITVRYRYPYLNYAMVCFQSAPDDCIVHVCVFACVRVCVRVFC